MNSALDEEEFMTLPKCGMYHFTYLKGETVKAGTQELGTERGMEVMWFHTGNNRGEK